jgi:hypothetical protein
VARKHKLNLKAPWKSTSDYLCGVTNEAHMESYLSLPASLIGSLPQ